MKHWRKLLWIVAVSGVTSAALLVIPAAKSESNAGDKAVIIGTASLRGEVSPCG